MVGPCRTPTREAEEVGARRRGHLFERAIAVVVDHEPHGAPPRVAVAGRLAREAGDDVARRAGRDLHLGGRAGLEHILGLRGRGDHFTINPCVPSSWTTFSITWKHRGATYEIEVSNPDRVWTGVLKAEIDGRAVDPQAIPLLQDGQHHAVRVMMGRKM